MRKCSHFSSFGPLLGILAICTLALPGARAQWGDPPAPAVASNPSSSPGYKVTDFVDDQSHAAVPHTDARLVNPWGIVLDSGMLVVADNGTGLLTMYGAGSGSSAHQSITVPPPADTNGTAAPDGLIVNPTKQFLIGSTHKKPATLLISTEDGTVLGWNSSSGTNAILLIDHSSSNAVYKGLAIGINSNNVPALYVSNFRSNWIEMYDTNYNFQGTFSDTNLTALGYAPFGIRTIQDKLVVAFAKQDPAHHDDVAGLGNGYIDIFNLQGDLVRSFAAQGQLDSPWGLTVAPLRFGEFSQALLIGNFGNGWINAYNVFTGEYLGALSDSTGAPISIPGLWGITFNVDPAAGDLEYTATTLYFASGPNGENDGLVGSIKPITPMFPPVH